MMRGRGKKRGVWIKKDQLGNNGGVFRAPLNDNGAQDMTAPKRVLHGHDTPTATGAT